MPIINRIQKDVWKNGSVVYKAQYLYKWLWFETWEYYCCEYGIIHTFPTVEAATDYINSKTKISTTYLYEKET